LYWIWLPKPLPPENNRIGLWLNRRGGAPWKLAKRPHPRKAQKQENAKKRAMREPGIE
jgi:hypothetical protein